ncbi:MAG: hypothetical protein NTY66_01430, partial [Candidatus Vogelbacteria bacterium]|nr:hypothetical protein [Candidatus Vogelbacteria bacterium]
MPDFLSLKEASKRSGYNQDYIGQLIRGGKVEARRVGKSWLVSRHSLVAYLSSIGRMPVDKEMFQTVTADTDFITLKEAAKHAGYNQDYIGQLIRGGKVGAQRLGKNWLVNFRSLVAYLKSIGKLPVDEELISPVPSPIIPATTTPSILTAVPIMIGPAGNPGMLPPRRWLKRTLVTATIVLAFFVGAGAVGAINLRGFLRFIPAALRLANFSKQINYQGKMRSVATNQAVADNDYAITFRLYTALTGGSAIWTEAQAVHTKNGLFSVPLGSVTPLDNVNLNQPLYLSVQVGADAEMSPRKLLGAVPAAIVAEQLNGHYADEFVFNNSTSTIASSSDQTILTLEQTGSGNIFQVLKSGVSKFFV